MKFPRSREYPICSNFLTDRVRSGSTAQNICSVVWWKEEAQMRRLVRNWNCRLLFNAKSGQEIVSHAGIHQEAKTNAIPREKKVIEADKNGYGAKHCMSLVE